MGTKVYTFVYEPFQIGGDCRGLIATEIEEYGRILLPGGFAALVVENPVKKLFHLFLEGCGALIKTGPDKEAIVCDATVDAVSGDPAIMKEQILKGMRDRDSARVVPLLEFFAKFRGEERCQSRKTSSLKKKLSKPSQRTRRSPSTP